MNDAYRFSLENRYIIEQAPLQTYHSALMFSPSTSLIRKLFESQAPFWVQCLSEVAKDWGSLLQTLEGHTGPVKSVTFSSDGQKLASASSDSVRIWDAANGTPLQTLQGDGGFKAIVSLTVTFSFDGQRVACLFGYPNFVYVWDVVFGSLLGTYDGMHKPITSIALSPDGHEIVSGYRDGTIVVRDITLGSLPKTFEGHAYITSVTFSPNGQKLASAKREIKKRRGGSDGAICVWNVASGAQLQMIEGNFTSVMFSPDGQKLASGSTHGTVNIWDAESGSLLQTLKDHRYSTIITWITFLYDGRNLACAGNNGIVSMWNTASGLLLRRLQGLSQGHGNGGYVAISPDEQKLAYGCNDHTVRIENTAFGSSVQTLKGHDDCIQSMTLSPNGQKLASVSRDQRVYIWDVTGGALLQMLEGYTESLLTFSPDGEKLAIICGYASGNEVIHIWDVTTGSRLQILEDYAKCITSISFSPNGEKLAYAQRSSSGARSLHLWVAGFGVKKFGVTFHDITSVNFSPDGQKLASLSHDSIIQVWNTASGSPLPTVADDYAWIRSSNQPERLSVIGRWVTVNQNRIIWLPPTRQAWRFVTYGTKIAIGSTTGVVTFLHLDFNQMDPYLTFPSASVDESELVESDCSFKQDDWLKRNFRSQSFN